MFPEWSFMTVAVFAFARLAFHFMSLFTADAWILFVCLAMESSVFAEVLVRTCMVVCASHQFVVTVLPTKSSRGRLCVQNVFLTWCLLQCDVQACNKDVEPYPGMQQKARHLPPHLAHVLQFYFLGLAYYFFSLNKLRLQLCVAEQDT